MQVDLGNLDLVKMYSELKFWSVVIGGFFTLHKGLKWLEGLKTSLTQIDKKLTTQTDAIVKELSELRNDFRGMAIPRPARASGRSRKKVLDNLLAE